LTFERMKTFIQQTAESILERIAWRELNSTTLVLPSHRAGLVLKTELLRLQKERQAQAVWAPQVCTLNQLQDELSPLYAEDELFTIVRLYRHYRSLSLQQPASDDIMSLDMFYGWGRQMIADFTNIDASMTAAEVPNFFENTIAAHELEQWKLDPETEDRLRSLIHSERMEGAADDSVRSQYEQLWRNLYRLYQALQEEMQAEHKGYAGMRQRAVITHWEDDAIQTKIKGRTYIFVGFNYLLPVERDLMLRLRDAGQAMFYWDYVPDFKTNEKAFSFTQLNKGILGGEHFPSPLTGHPLPVTLVECMSKEAQAQYVHRWLEENYTAKGQRVGVVICDETMLEPVIYTLPAIRLDGDTEPAPINITKGFPLRNTAVYARVLNWLNEQARGKADEPAEPELMDRMTEEVLSVKAEEAEKTDSLSWKELLVLESEYQVRTIANKIRKLMTDGLGELPFTRKLLRMFMRRMMESVTMPFHGEPVTDVQVMGVLETRLLDFDKLLILNVEEGVIPQRQADYSFIPFYLRKAYHMQTSDERATVYAYNFFRLLARAGHATLLYATAETAEGGKGMSRFVMQMMYSDEFEMQRVTLQEAARLTDTQPAQEEERFVSLLSTLHVENGVIKRADGSDYRMSPSALNTYVTCPRSFYRHYIEGLAEPKDEKGPFAPNTMGSFVHLMTEYIYRQYMGCHNTSPVRISPEMIDAVCGDEAKMEEALQAAYREMPQFKTEEHIAENVIIKGYVRNILERDREDAKTGLQIWMLEKDRSFPVTIEGVGQMKMGGKIDRLDIYGTEGNECIRVIDYKSGGYNDTTHAKKMSSLMEEVMTNPDKSYVRQTLVYCHAVTDKRDMRPIEPNLFFCQRKLTGMETTLAIDDEPLHDYRKIADAFIRHLETKVAEVLQTNRFSMCEEGDCPNYCPFFSLCGRKPKEL